MISDSNDNMAAAEKPRAGRRPRGSDIVIGDGSVSLVNAVSRALSILDCFERAERPLGNQDIARLTNLPKSTVSRITRTLTELRYLHFRSDIEKYQLGPRVLALANTFQRMDPMSTMILPVLQELADATRSTVGVGTVEGVDAVYTHVVRGVSMIMLQVDTGTRLPLLGSALGLALVGGSSKAVRERIVAGLKVQHKADWAVTGLRLDKSDEELGRLGYCTSIGTWHEDINGVAAPLRFVGDSTVYAINIGGPTFLMDADQLYGVHGPKLLQTIASLEKRGLVEPVFPIEAG